MYIPSYFEWKDTEEAFAFVQRYNFGLLITAQGGSPMATHLPFIAEKQGDAWLLISHMAAANGQSGILDKGECLVVFSEPHAYISPTLYEKSQNVPTWNYLAVHCYGAAKIIGSDEGKIAALEKMIDFYESAYRRQWRELSDKYKNNLLGELTAFEIAVARIEAKAKLSQNKKEGERENIIHSLENSTDQAARDLSAYMKRKD